MKNPFAYAAVFCAVLGCSGGQKAAQAPIPRVLRDQCTTLKEKFAKNEAEGTHERVTLVVEDGTVAPLSARTLSESEAVAKLAEAKAGDETWILARGGAGKSHLARALEAELCGQRATLRVDVGVDLRAKLVTATKARPALAELLLAQLGVPKAEDDAAALRDALGGTSWLLLLDGTDELTPTERKKLMAELAWLREQELHQHVVRFERPGFADVHVNMAPTLLLRVPELTCEQVDAQWTKRFADETTRGQALEWLKKHRLDRKRIGETCHYVHLATWRDVETVLDLAADALQIQTTQSPTAQNQPVQDPAAGLDDLSRDPVRADIYATWLAHRLHDIAATADGALGWLDRIVAQGVLQATEPDLLLTVNRCEGAAPPASTTPEQACRGLMRSSIARRGQTPGVWTLPNQTVADLLLARWVTAKQTDCALLTAATTEMSSLEMTAMVTSLPQGRRCLNPLISAVCSRGTPAAEVAVFLDEAMPVELRDASFFAVSSEAARGTCEKAVFAALRLQPEKQ